MTCPYCGAKIPPNNTGTSFTCEYCGNLIVLHEDGKSGIPANSDKVTLTIEYEANGYIVIPDMQVTITKDDQKKSENLIERSIPVHRKLKLHLDKGKYSLFFRSSVRKNTTKIVLDHDIYLFVGWNRATGKIVVNEVENADELI